MVNIVLVDAKGKTRLNKAALLTAEGISKALRKAQEPSVIQTWRLTEDDIELTLWGWRTAYAASVKSATFNLPAPCGKCTLFGDLVITATSITKGKPIDLTEDAWESYRGRLGPDSATADTESVSDADSEADAEAEPEINGDEIEVLEDDCDDDDEDEDEEQDEDDGGDGDAEEEESEIDEEGAEEEGDAEEADELEGEDDEDCYDSDDGGGGKRRAPRRRAIAAPEFRRMEMGLRSSVKMPIPAGKRAPRWQTAPELEPEPEPEPESATAS